MIVTGWLADRLVPFIDADIDNTFDAEIAIATQVAADAESLVTKTLKRSGLSSRDQAKLRRRLQASHWLCEVLATMLCIRRHGRQKLDEFVSEVTRSVVARVVYYIVQECGVWTDMPLAQTITERLLRTVIEAQVKKLVNILDDPKRVFAVCLVTIAVCPDIDKHPKVTQECLEPIAARLRQALLVTWLVEHCPARETLTSQQRRALNQASERTLVG